MKDYLDCMLAPVSCIINNKFLSVGLSGCYTNLKNLKVLNDREIIWNFAFRMIHYELINDGPLSMQIGSESLDV